LWNQISHKKSLPAFQSIPQKRFLCISDLDDFGDDRIQSVLMQILRAFAQYESFTIQRHDKYFLTSDQNKSSEFQKNNFQINFSHEIFFIFL